jgi:peptidoglycan/LPS O-acetylase OafA/YrhL
MTAVPENTTRINCVTAISKHNNMNLVRFYMALMVLMSHFNYVFGIDIFIPTSSYNAVGGFFALSGFLVYGSYNKCAGSAHSIYKYIKSRARRILPPYLTIVFCCAFGLCLVSTYSFTDYFLSKDWWAYLAANVTFLNFIHPTLPGVFDGESINGSLWTLKVEWALYLSVPLVFVLMHRLGRTWQILLSLYVVSVAYRFIFMYLYDNSGREIYVILSRQFLGQLTYFYVGVAIRIYLQQFLKYRHIVVILALILALVGTLGYKFEIICHPIAVSVLAMYVSIAVPELKIGRKIPNISYSVYLFHMPIIQLVYMIELSSGCAFVVSLMATITLALASWYYVESYFCKSLRV